MCELFYPLLYDVSSFRKDEKKNSLLSYRFKCFLDKQAKFLSTEMQEGELRNVRDSFSFTSPGMQVIDVDDLCEFNPCVST